jgi:hypothetical protein
MTQCPVCQQTLQRIQRKPIERSLSYLIPVMRFQCFNAACRWGGLRIKLDAHPLLAAKRNAENADRS